MIPKRFTILAALCLLFSHFLSAQETGIFQTYVTLDYNGQLEYFHGGENSDNQRGADAFEGQYLGTFSPSDNISIAGAEIHTWKTGSGNVTGAELSYSIYKVGSSSSFATVNVPFCCNSGENNTCNLGETCTGAGAGDQRWSETAAGINILSGLDAGDYTIQVFFKALDNEGDKFDSDTANGDYQATFTVGSEGFLDEDLSIGASVWSGETNNFSILDPTSFTGNGSNANINGVGSINKQVLVSNESINDAVITTASTQAYGTWQFSIASGDGWNFSASNKIRVMLISDESDPAKLKGGNFDFNGYYLEFGQGGSLDYFEIDRVSGGSTAAVLTTAYPALTDLSDGYRIRITRDINGNWELFADQGFDGPAASTSQGTGNDNTHTTSSFFGLTTDIANAGTARRVYYDNISFNPNTSVSFDTASSDNDETDGSVTLTVNLADPSVVEDTSVDVVLVKGDPTRVDNYSTQTLIFPAGSSAAQDVVVNIADNDLCDYNTTFVFELQNVMGGVDAAASDDDTFTINLNDDNTTSEANREDDFEDGDLADWIGDTAEFTNDGTTTLNGNQALHTDSEVADGDVYLSLPAPFGDAKGGVTTWEFSFRLGQKDPNTTNKFIMYLMSNEDDLTSSAIDGYAVAMNGFLDLPAPDVYDADDRLKLYKVTDGVFTELINSAENMNNFDSHSIRVTRTETGEWELFFGESSDFSDLESKGTFVDNTYDFFGGFGVVSHKGQEDGSDTNWTDWEVWIDDMDIHQEFCSGAYESTGTGTSSSTNWQLVGTADPVTPPFNKYTEIIVRDGDVMTLDGDIRTHLVTIEPTGELDLGADFELAAYSDVTIDGTLTANKGSVTLAGNGGEQAISGLATPTFYELNIENEDGASFSTDANFYGPIHPEAGTLDFGTQTITLASGDIAGEILTGSISEIKSGADVTGEITMERYLETDTDGFRIIAIPVTGQTIESALNDDFITTGFPGSDFPDFNFLDNPDPTYVNLYTYDETATGTAEDGYIPVGNITEAINDEKAYIAYFPPETTNYTFDATGDFKKGDITLNVTYTPDNGDPSDGWHMIPNPYPSAIDINSASITYTNVQVAAYVLDNTVGDWKGQYRSWIGGVSNNGGSNILSSYQGFFVKATAPGASITFSEGCKVDDQAGYIRTEDASRQVLNFSINQGESKYETTLSFHDQASAGFDSEFDAYFFGENPAPGTYALASKSEESYYAINTLGELNEEISVPLKMAVATAGEYTLKLENQQNILSSACLFIEDTETQEFYPVNNGFELLISVSEENYVTERFILHAKPGADFESQMASCYGSEDGQISLTAPNYTDWTIEWFDNENVSIGTSNDNSSVLSGLTAGSYTAVLTSTDELCNALTQEIAVIQPGEEEISMSYTPTTCSEDLGFINVDVSNANEWTVSAVANGELVTEQTGTETAQLSELPGGIYTVQVSTSCNTEELEINLSDENAVQSAFNAPAEIILENSLAVLSVVNTSENALYTEWYLDGELISQEYDFSYEFISTGEHELTLISFNDFCSSESSQVILVSTADNIVENQLVVSIINTDTDWILNLEEWANSNVEVYDSAGKLVITERITSSAYSVSKSSLSTGVYTLIITSESKMIHTAKLIK